MTTLRESVDGLPRFAPGTNINLTEVASYLGLTSTSARAVIDGAVALARDVTLSQRVETDDPVSGGVELILRKDGSHTFSGHMRATGLTSHSYRVTVVLRAPDGTGVLAAQKSGNVYGTDTPGDQVSPWNEVGGNDTPQAKVIRSRWPEISRCHIDVQQSTGLTGVLGGGLHILEDVGKFVVAAALVGSPAAACLVLGSELANAGVSVPGIGGVVGLTIVAGTAVILGPLAIVPAIVIGVAAGALVDSMIHLREMREDEKAFVRSVYGDTIDFGPVRITNLSGFGTRPFTVPTIDGKILVNLGNAADSPLTAMFPSYPRAGQVLIHELAHVWQYQHAQWHDGYVPGLICSGLLDQAFGDGYKYGSAGQEWSSYSMESQAAIIDQWFGGNRRQAGRPQEDLDSPYFRYLNDNVRLGEP
jgi:hypothetical protein